MFRAGYGSKVKGGIQLRTGDAVVPLEELIDGAAVIQMVEKCLRRNSRSPEDKGTAHYFRVLREHVEQGGDCIHTDKMTPTTVRVNG